MKRAIALAALLLVVGCSPDSTSTAAGPGNEATSESAPAQEDTPSPDDSGDSGNAQGQDHNGDAGEKDDKEISVELPGLPIGGNEVLFSPDAPTQCVDVNTTGFTLPDGVEIVLMKLVVPDDQFTLDPSPCPDAPTCVEGSFRFSDTGCSVSLRWKGDPVDAGQSFGLGVDAKGYCTSRAACAQVEAATRDAKEQRDGPFTIRLIVEAPADGGSTSGDGESTPTDGGATSGDSESTPTDGGSTPTDGGSEGPSPSADSSDG